LAKAELTKPCASKDSRIAGIKTIRYVGSRNIYTTPPEFRIFYKVYDSG
jgi:hypothetical protein